MMVVRKGKKNEWMKRKRGIYRAEHGVTRISVELVVSSSLCQVRRVLKTEPSLTLH